MPLTLILALLVAITVGASRSSWLTKEQWHLVATCASTVAGIALTQVIIEGAVRLDSAPFAAVYFAIPAIAAASGLRVGAFVGTHSALVLAAFACPFPLGHDIPIVSSAGPLVALPPAESLLAHLVAVFGPAVPAAQLLSVVAALSAVGIIASGSSVWAPAACLVAAVLFAAVQPSLLLSLEYMGCAVMAVGLAIVGRAIVASKQSRAPTTLASAP